MTDSTYDDPAVGLHQMRERLHWLFGHRPVWKVGSESERCEIVKPRPFPGSLVTQLESSQFTDEGSSASTSPWLGSDLRPGENRGWDVVLGPVNHGRTQPPRRPLPRRDRPRRRHDRRRKGQNWPFSGLDRIALYVLGPVSSLRGLIVPKRKNPLLNDIRHRVPSDWNPRWIAWTQAWLKKLSFIQRVEDTTETIYTCPLWSYRTRAESHLRVDDVLNFSSHHHLKNEILFFCCSNSKLWLGGPGVNNQDTWSGL